jgi:Prenyltransferase and squalene oxidase repeat
MELYDEEGNVVRVEEAHQTWWQKWGGGSLIIAAIFHAILLVIGAFWVFKIIQEPEKKVDFMPPGGGGGERGAEHKMKKARAQITPTTNSKRVFAQGAVATYAIPEQGDNFGEMSQLSSLSGGGMSGGLGGSGSGSGFGKGNGLGGGGLGNGAGVGKLFGLIPEGMRKRCSKEDRLQRLKDNGGTAACDEAVTKGLRWLKANQNSDGSWGKNNKPAMTGLALLAYFGHCETPASEEFGDSCVKGITYLTDLGMKNEGKMASNFTGQPWVYEHGIATYALGEAYTFCKELKYPIPGLPEVTEMAGQFIIDNQNKNGGWAYQYATSGGHTDSSVVGWQLQALKACSHTDIKYKGLKSCADRGLEYLATLQNENGGFGYSGKGANAGGKAYFSLTGVGALCFQMWGQGNKSEAKKGVKYIKENTKFVFNGADSDLYAHYYESQAMMQAGGENWKHYNDLFRDQMLNNQNPDGSFKEPGFRGHGIGGNEVYRNALCILMLEVYYRFLNTGGGARGSSRIGI